MPAYLLAEVDLTFDFFACAFVLGMIAVVLLTGWLTRTTAVVWVAVFLLCLAGVVLGIWLAYRFDGLEEPVTPGFAVLRLIAGAAAILLVVAIWALVKMVRRYAAVRPVATSIVAPPKPPEERYDRDWMLSLLQKRTASSKEEVAKATPPDDAHRKTSATSEYERPVP
ncbi:MAG: hypothetical protein WBC44_21520 [Planctomycetaceae bacterium]